MIDLPQGHIGHAHNIVARTGKDAKIFECRDSRQVDLIGTDSAIGVRIYGQGESIDICQEHSIRAAFGLDRHSQIGSAIVDRNHIDSLHHR